MNRTEAAIVVVGLLALTVGFFFAPWPVLAAGLVIGILFITRPLGWLTFAAITIGLDALLVAWASPGPGPSWSLGPINLGSTGASRGAIGGLRIAAIVVANVSVLQRAGPAQLLEALRLPRRATASTAALLLATQEIGRHARSLIDAQKMVGGWPKRKWRRIPVAAGLIPHLMVLSVSSARRRRDAMQLAGIPTGSRFVPLLAITALALAGRLALIAVPNISLTYVIVFAGGLVFGWRIGAAAGALAMAASDVLLSGFVPTSFVNVPAMALVGLLGGIFAQSGLADRSRFWAGLLGITATFMFSAASDFLEWLIVPEFRGDVPYLYTRMAAGFAFNVIPALVNGFLFAGIIRPAQLAFSEAHEPHPQLPRPAN